MHAQNVRRRNDPSTRLVIRKARPVRFTSRKQLSKGFWDEANREDRLTSKGKQRNRASALGKAKAAAQLVNSL